MLTPHQQQALDTDRHLSVTANAGAGKTTVLVRRFVDILVAGKARVHEIVAITYTEKAASELRKKIADHLEERIGDANGRHEESARLVQARNQLASATIGTIHSFCAQILREYPVEADVDASFTVLEGADEQALLEDALTEILTVMLGRGRSPEFEHVVDAVRLLGKKSFQRYVLFFLSNRERMERLLAPGGIYGEGRGDDEILGTWRSRMEEAVIPPFTSTLWAESLGRLLLHSSGKQAPEAARVSREFAEAKGSRLALLADLTSTLFTKTGSIRKDVTGLRTDLTPVQRDADFLCETFKEVRGLLRALAGGEGREGDRSLLRTTRTLLDVYHRAAAVYEEQKQDQGFLDFEDLQLKARLLLSDAAIRSRLSERYRFVMVDEFQDTNQLQYDILKLLVADYAGANLFIVGDPKQSIYGFRSAEVEVFSSAKEDIVRAAAGRGGGELILAESFRPLSQLARFVNHLFSGLMGSSGSAFDIPYADLVRGRRSDAEGRVELHLLSNDPGSGEPGDPVGAECDTVARRLAELSRSGYPIEEGRSAEAREFRFRDAAILLRNRTHLKQIEQALVMHRIPYLLSGGIGFYQTQEIADFLNYFSFLLNPDDDVALVGILRSPFFVLSDRELYEISLDRSRASFWEKLGAKARESGASASVRNAASILAADRELANRLSIPLLVQRMFRVTGWRGTVAGLDRGEQHAANIGKLLRIAREFEGRGLSTLYDFVQRLKGLVDSEEREGQASLELGGNAVHVMTVHAAKGLEFPAVFLPFTHEKFRYDQAPLVDAAVGVGFPMRREDDLDADAVVPTLDLLKFRNRQRVEAEEKRVFYVATTRARDLLAISGSLSAREPRASTLGWVLESLGLDRSAPPAGLLRLSAAPLRVLGADARPGAPSEHLDVHVNEPIAPGAPPRRTTTAPAIGSADDGRFLSPLRGQTKGEFFSATQIRTFMECPSKFYLRYVLGLPEFSAPPPPFDEEEEPSDVIVGEAEGSYTHAILQEIRDPDVTRAEIEARVQTLLAGEHHLSNAERSALRARVAENVANFVSSEAGRELLSAAETRTEFSISARFDDDYLTGIVDRLARSADGTWHIVDYKTDRIDPSQIGARAELYRPQLAFYALLVSRLFPRAAIRATLIFLKAPERPVRLEFGESDRARFQAEVKEVIRKIKERDFTRAAARCDGCTYQRGGACVIGEFHHLTPSAP